MSTFRDNAIHKLANLDPTTIRRGGTLSTAGFDATMKNRIPRDSCVRSVARVRRKRVRGKEEADDWKGSGGKRIGALGLAQPTYRIDTGYSVFQRSFYQKNSYFQINQLQQLQMR